jgi:hypothetical protein
MVSTSKTTEPCQTPKNRGKNKSDQRTQPFQTLKHKKSGGKEISILESEPVETMWYENGKSTRKRKKKGRIRRPQ